MFLLRPFGASIAYSAAASDDLFHHFFPSKDHYYLHTAGHFGIYYDSRTRTPKWVLEHFHQDTSLPSPAIKLKRPNFYSDMKVDDAFQLSPRDYTNSGYDRGHLAAAGSYNKNEIAHRATFTMANIVPQAPSLNKGFWKHLEAFTMRLLKDNQEIVVISGPAYLPIKTSDNKWVYDIPTIGTFPRLCQVPSHFYKIIITRNKFDQNSDLQVGAFLIPNSDEVSSSSSPLQYVVKISDLESLVGLRFFDSFLASNFTSHLDCCIVEKDSKHLEKSLTKGGSNAVEVIEPRQVAVKNDSAYVVVENVTYAFRHLCANGKCDSLFQ